MSLIENYESSDSEQEDAIKKEEETKDVKEDIKTSTDIKTDVDKFHKKSTHSLKRKKCELPDTDDLFGEEHIVPDFLKKSKEFCPIERELVILDDRKQQQQQQQQQLDAQKKLQLNFKDTHGPLEPPREITQREIEKYVSAGTRRGGGGRKESSNAPRSTETARDELDNDDMGREGEGNEFKPHHRDGRGGTHKNTTTTEKEKRKLNKRQNEWRNDSSNGYWKSDEEMKLRQQYD